MSTSSCFPQVSTLEVLEQRCIFAGMPRGDSNRLSG